jgi:hypothetical protein
MHEVLPLQPYTPSLRGLAKEELLYAYMEIFRGTWA